MTQAEAMPPPFTPDRRYIIVRGRLWRAANPNLPAADRAALVGRLMAARRAVGASKRMHNPIAEQTERIAVDAAKQALGERGEPCWDYGAPDLNRRMVGNTLYAPWYAALDQVDRQ